MINFHSLGEAIAIAWRRSRLIVPFIAMVTACVCPMGTFAQDSSVGRLPDGPFAYFWTDDFPQLLDDFEKLSGSLREELNQAINVASFFDREQELSQRLERQLEQNAEKLLLLKQIWSGLKDDELFDGELILVVAPNTQPIPAEEQNFSTFPGDSQQLAWGDSILLAQTSANESEIADLIAKLERLAALSKPEPSDDRAANEDEGTEAELNSDRQELERSWIVDDGWFCWASRLELAKQWHAHVTKSTTASAPLSRQREFRTVSNRLLNRSAASPSLSFYLSGETLPAVAFSFRSLSIYFQRFSPEQWKQLYLDELRAAGGRLYLSRGPFNDQAGSPVVLDAFVIATQPQRGLLRGIGKESLDRMTLEHPTIDAPIRSFSYIAVDGPELKKGIDEINDRFGVDSPDSEIYQFRESFSELTFVDAERPAWALSPDKYSRWTIGRINNPEQFRSTYESLFLNYFFAKDEAIVSALTQATQSDVWTSAIQASYVERARKQMESSVAMLEKHLAESKESMDDKAFEIEREKVESSKTYQRNFVDGIQSPSLLLVDGWSISSQDLAANIDNLAENFYEPHSQLKELHSTVSKVQEIAKSKGTLAAMWCFWSDGVWKQNMLDRKVTREDLDEFWKTLRERSGDLEVEQVQTLKLQELAMRRFDRVILTIENEDDAYRIHGVLTERLTDDDDK